MTPSYLKALEIKHTSSDCINEIQHTLVVGGESFAQSDYEYWQQSLLPNAVFINHYGPTETVVGRSLYRLTKRLETAPSRARLPIGRPINNSRFYIFNTDCQLTPMGLAGELMIGGVGLARGYLNQPELTAEKFIANPFYDGDDPYSSKHLYKTGDLVRWLSDGNLEYLGRIDHQVKLRGFRVELGEIETQLVNLEEVRESLVILDDSDVHTRLVAYLVVNDGAKFDDESLRRRISRFLPDYMIPSIYIKLPALPMTANGKVDRKALPYQIRHTSR